MRCNIYEEQLRSAELFGKPVLYTEKQVQRESVPEGWHCYNLSGSDRDLDKPSALENKTVWNRIGTVLSPVPLKRETTLTRRIKDSFHLHEELLDLAGFCEKHHLECPSDPRKFILRPASPQEAGLFYSQMKQDEQLGVVGHVRLDFGGGRLHHSWWPHNDDRFNTPACWRRGGRKLRYWSCVTWQCICGSSGRIFCTRFTKRPGQGWNSSMRKNLTRR